MKKIKLLIIFLILALFLTVSVVVMVIWKGDNGLWKLMGQPEKTEDGSQCMVKFLSDDGTVLKVNSVAKGNSADPPIQPPLAYGMVFQSWDADLSYITEDIETHPQWIDVKGKVNVFAIDSAYGKSGDTISVPIRLCGEVCTSAFDMTISYDADALELISVTEDGAVLYNDELPGTIRLNYVSTDNTVADVDICWLKFNTKESIGKIPMTLEIHSIYACENSLESENDDFYVPEYTLVNGTATVLPKGE